MSMACMSMAWSFVYVGPMGSVPQVYDERKGAQTSIVKVVFFVTMATKINNIAILACHLVAIEIRIFPINALNITKIVIFTCI